MFGGREPPREAESMRAQSSRPSLAPEEYAGVYRDAWYGDISIVRVNDKLEMRFNHTPDLTGQLEHWQFDTFAVRWYDLLNNVPSRSISNPPPHLKFIQKPSKWHEPGIIFNKNRVNRQLRRRLGFCFNIML